MTTAFYGRYSTDLQNERSPEDQLEACRRHFANHPQVPPITAAFMDVVEDANAKFFTIANGEVTTMHVAFHGGMNQMALEETARKVKRGVWAKVSAGKHAGPIPYGYESDGTVGGRRINADEAAIVRRVFDLTLTGMSGVRIAKLFNGEGIPAPRAQRWRSSTVCGDRRSGDGILNNELYRGRMVWNRHRYKRNRQTGKRRGELHPESEWLFKDVPELRIIDEETWTKVRPLQQSRERPAPLHTTRRPKRLLSGLIQCSTCGGLFTVVNRDRLACSNSREGTCSERGRLPWSVVEERVLAGVKQNLLAADIVADAVKQCRQHMRVKTAEQDRRRRDAERDVQDARRRAQTIVELMIAAKSPTLLANLQDVELEIGRLELILREAGEAVVVTIHPGAPEAYRRRITNLEEALADDNRRDELAAVIRPLVAGITVGSRADAPDGWEITLHGQLASIMDMTKQKPLDVSAEGSSHCTAMVGAGVGFEPTTFRL